MRLHHFDNRYKYHSFDSSIISSPNFKFQSNFKKVLSMISLKNIPALVIISSLAACGGGGGDTSTTSNAYGGMSMAMAMAPVITSQSSYSVAENQTSIATVTATDSDSSSLIFSLSGTDASA